MIRTIAIFGATGDLTGRYLMPALAALLEAGLVTRPFRILGIAPDEWDWARFCRHTAEWLESCRVGEGARDHLLACLDYRPADVTDRAQVAAALAPLEEPLVAYLALPSSLFAPSVESLAAARPPTGSRIVVEKPFGEDLASARALNRLLHESFPEEAVFRIDHFLGMQAVQCIPGLRFGNRLFDAVWNREHVERVEVLWDETIALEGRASYYDRSGALRDMIQNHLLQVMSLVAMEPPSGPSADDWRGRKVELLRSVTSVAAEEVDRLTVRARYTAGAVAHRRTSAYVDEPGVDPTRNTETFAQVSLRIENARWAGVPFLLRAGKALARDRQEIVVSFKPVSRRKRAADCGNRFRLDLGTGRVSLEANVAGLGDDVASRAVALHAELPPQRIPAYGRLLHDVLRGDLSLAVRDDEVEESWRIVDPVLEAWTKGYSRLKEYAAGSEGPAMAEEPMADR